MSSAPFRALIVDDEVVVRKMLIFALSQENFVCDSANDGEEALTKLPGHDFDLVITDLRMPNKHGYALANELLDRPLSPIVVVHSSIDNPNLIKDLMSRGVDDIVCKPASYKWLAAKLKGLAIRRRIQREQQRQGIEEFLHVSPAAIDVLMNADLEGGTINSFTESVRRDPLLSNELIRMANSATYNPARREIKSLGEAVTRLGMKRICEFITDELSRCTNSISDPKQAGDPTKVLVSGKT